MNIENVLEYSNKEREISKIENRQTKSKHTDGRKDTSYTYKGQPSTDKDDRKIGHMLGHMLIIPFPVSAGIKINSSRNRKWNSKNVRKL